MRYGAARRLAQHVYPGVTRLVERTFADVGSTSDVAFCPERIAKATR